MVALKSRLREEGVTLPRELFHRSTSAIILAALKPFALLIIGTLLFTQFRAYPVLAVFCAFVFFLLSQRFMQTLVHDSAHLFYNKIRSRNDKLANWFCAGWIGQTTENYRKVHKAHHAFNGSLRDPEHMSFAGVEKNGGLLKMCISYISLGEAFRLFSKYYLEKNSAGSQQAGPTARLWSMKHIAATQLALIAFFYLAGAPVLYLLWLYLAVSWSPLLSRLRFLLEHPGEDETTVTTYANFIDKSLFAPLNFNYHYEHHCWPNLPPYQFKQAHRYLAESGYYSRHPEIIRRGFSRRLFTRGA
jgi:fatty acid desaturase